MSGFVPQMALIMPNYSVSAPPQPTPKIQNCMTQLLEKKMQKFIPLIARTFLAIIFIRAGFDKAFVDFAGTQQQMADAGIPIPFIVLLFTIAFQILGGISLILGYKAKIGAILLIIFLLPATLVFHNPLVDPTQSIDFMKNLAILGGLLMVVSFGAGILSLDERDRYSKVSDYP